MEAEVRELIATVQSRHLRALLERVFGERLRAVGRLPRRARRQVLPPGLPPRPARALAGVAQAVSAISATFPDIDRDVAVTGALLHDIGKLEAYSEDAQSIDLTDAGRLMARSRSATTASAARSRTIAGFPRRARAGGRAHHPLPSRLARARQPGRALHTRGNRRAHDRQPRRATRQLRPAREGAQPRPPLVELRPRHRRRRLLRRSLRRGRVDRRASPEREAACAGPVAAHALHERNGDPSARPPAKHSAKVRK